LQTEIPLVVNHVAFAVVILITLGPGISPRSTALRDLLDGVEIPSHDLQSEPTRTLLRASMPCLCVDDSTE